MPARGGGVAWEQWDWQAADPISQLRDELRRLHVAVGEPTYGKLQAMAALNGRQLPTSAAHALLQRQNRPQWPTVETFVEACKAYASIQRRGLEPTSENHDLFDLLRWQELHRARSARPPRQAAGWESAAPVAGSGEWPVRRAPDPEVLGVAPCDGALPAYVRRDHDVALMTAVGSANRVSRLVVLVGEAGSGKTRAAWEAVQLLPTGWRLWWPQGHARAEMLLAGLESSTRSLQRTAIWLDACDDLLEPAQPLAASIAGALQQLLEDPERGPVLIIGTLRADAVASFGTAARPVVDLLRRHTVRVPSHFRRHRRSMTAVAARDPRWLVALSTSGARPLLHFCGTAAHRERFRVGTAAEQAVLLAAAALSRAGCSTPLSQRLVLTRAAELMTSPGDVSVLARSTRSLVAAWTSLQEPRWGAAAPLALLSDGSVRLSASLHDHLERDG